MLENAIFHFVTLIFILCAFLWWLDSFKKKEFMEKVVIPVLLRSSLSFPKDRSLVVRMKPLLCEKIAAILKTSVDIHFIIPIENKEKYENYLIPMCNLAFLEFNKADDKMTFEVDNKTYSSIDFYNYVKLLNTNKFIFSYNFDKQIWIVKVTNI